MKVKLVLLLASSSMLASFGQILLKRGADGARSLDAFLNLALFGGLGLYALSTAIWIYALSFVRLNVVYAFTTLTFVCVYVFSFLILKERMNLHGLAGVLLVLLGLYLIVVKGVAD
ncbi:MAG: EamA family transporter [Syntrophobacteraceae bacterium]|nr:EamA family transporter [Syntrophobacteraceae bacterium]NTV42958.1 EamA family transporter [Syntrophobacteraceae bacterium]